MSFDEERRADNNNRSSSSNNIHSVRYVEPRPRDLRDSRDNRDPRDIRDRDMERDREIRERERYERPRERDLSIRDKRFESGQLSNRLLMSWFVSDIMMISSTTGSVSWRWRRAATTPTWRSTAASPGPPPPATLGRGRDTTRTPSGEYSNSDQCPDKYTCREPIKLWLLFECKDLCLIQLVQSLHF